MFECGVLDSATVVENSLQNSVSVASLVLTSGVCGGQLLDGFSHSHLHRPCVAITYRMSNMVKLCVETR